MAKNKKAIAKETTEMEKSDEVLTVAKTKKTEKLSKEEKKANEDFAKRVGSKSGVKYFSIRRFETKRDFIFFAFIKPNFILILFIKDFTFA